MNKTPNFSNLNSWMKSYVDHEKFIGSSVLIAVDNKVIHKNHFGFRKKNQLNPFDFDTVVRIFSMTKPITSLGLMTLEDKGLIDLNSPLSDFIPSFKNCTALTEGAKNINEVEEVPSPTLMHLLTHTSGLSYSFNDSLIGRAYSDVMNANNKKAKNSWPETIATNPALDLEMLCNNLAQFPLSFHPGRKWEYSMSIDVIGRIIEIVSGKNLSDYLEETIFEPLGMDNTGFSFKNGMEQRLADCYLKEPEDAYYKTYLDKPHMYYKENMKLFLGGSGLLSTITDYFKFTQLITDQGIYNGSRIISPTGVQKLTTNMIAKDIASIGPKEFSFMSTVGMGHGLGGSVIVEPQSEFSSSIGDYSWGGMASTYFWIDRVNQMTTIFFTQLIPSNSYPNRPELKKLVRNCMDLN